MKNIISAFQRLLFDNKCPVCEAIRSDDNEFLCEECEKYFKTQSLKKYEDVYYIWDYDEKFKKIIEGFKFYGKKELGEYLGKLIEMKLEFVIKNEHIDIIIPVPVHKKREQERGFNQAEEILSVLKKEYIKAERKKNTKHMYGILNKDKRGRNISKSFEVSNKKEIEGKKVLIFDDIITTGSTIEELKQEIKKAGAESVCSMVLAAAPFYKNNIINKKCDT